MSVTTTADRLRDEAKEKIIEAAKATRQAYKLLVEVSCTETWGADGYSSTYAKILQDAEIDVMQISRALTEIKNKL